MVIMCHIKAVKICTPASPSLQVQGDRHKLNDQVQVRYPGGSDDILFFHSSHLQCQET